MFDAGETGTPRLRFVLPAGKWNTKTSRTCEARIALHRSACGEEMAKDSDMRPSLQSPVPHQVHRLPTAVVHHVSLLRIDCERRAVGDVGADVAHVAQALLQVHFACREP